MLDDMADSRDWYSVGANWSAVSEVFRRTRKEVDEIVSITFTDG